MIEASVAGDLPASKFRCAQNSRANGIEIG